MVLHVSSATKIKLLETVAEVFADRLARAHTDQNIEAMYDD